MDIQSLLRQHTHALELTEGGPPSPPSNPYFGVGPITDGTINELDGRLRRFEFEHWIEKTYRKLDGLGRDVGSFSAAELGRSMHRGTPADQILTDMMRTIHRYFEFPAQNKMAIGLGGGHSGFSVCVTHLLAANDRDQRIFVDTPTPETDEAVGTGFFRRSWGQQIVELLGNDRDRSRISFATHEGLVPTATELEALGIKLFVGVGHETTSATTYTESDVCELLEWIRRDPLNHHAIIDATSMLGAMPWRNEVVKEFMSQTCMFFPLQKAVGGVPGYFLASFTPEALQTIERNQNPAALAIPRQLKLTVPADPRRPVSGPQTVASGPFYDPEEDRMVGGVINTFSLLAFAETTYSLKKLEERCGPMSELNRRSIANRTIVDDWLEANPLFSASVQDRSRRGTAVTLLKVTDGDVQDRKLHDLIVTGAKQILSYEGMTRGDGTLEPGLGVARYINAFPGTGGDFRAWIGGIRAEADITALLENLKYAYLRAKVVVLEQQLKKAGVKLLAEEQGISEGTTEMQRVYRILIADPVGLKFTPFGKQDPSEVRDHIVRRGGIFHDGNLPTDDALQCDGLHFFYHPDVDIKRHLDEVASLGVGYDAVIVAAKHIPAEANFKEGGVRIGVGTGNMGCASWGGPNGGGSAPLMNTPGVNAKATAHMVLKALLREEPSLPIEELHTQVMSGTFDTTRDLRRYPTAKLEGKRFAVIGFGNIGREVARLARAFNMNVIVYAREGLRLEIERAGYSYAASIEGACDRADIVSVHVGLGRYEADGARYANESLLGEGALSVLSDGAIVINFDRAEVIDRSALGAALDESKIRAVYIDADMFLDAQTGEVTGPIAPFREIALKYPTKFTLLPHAAADTDHPSRVAGAMQAIDQIFDAVRLRLVRNPVGPIPPGYTACGAISFDPSKFAHARVMSENLAALCAVLSAPEASYQSDHHVDAVRDLMSALTTTLAR